MQHGCAAIHNATPLLSESPFANMQVWWEDLDSQNRPILMVRLGQALNQCKSRAEADRVAECIVSQVSRPSLYIFLMQACFVLHQCWHLSL